MALVGLLAFLFARPFLTRQEKSDSQRLRIILIEHSASMSLPSDGGRLIDDAIAAESDAAREIGKDATIMWATFDTVVQPVEGVQAIDRTPSSMAEETNFDAAIRWASDRVVSPMSMQADVVLVSDLQQSGFDVRADRGDIVATLPEGDANVAEARKELGQGLCSPGMSSKSRSSAKLGTRPSRSR